MGKILNVTEGREALVNTAKNILARLDKRGFTYDINCYFSDIGLVPIPDDASERATLIVIEVDVRHADVEERILLEGALAVDGGEVLNDEIIREANKLRRSVDEILSALENHSDPREAVRSLAPPEEESQPRPVFDNRMYYIGGIIIAVIITVVLVLMNK